MAIMNISVSKEDLPLITNVQEQSNECRTVFTFDIQAYPGDPIELRFERAEGGQPYDKIETREGSTWSTLIGWYNGTVEKNFNMGTSRLAQVRIHIGNTLRGNNYNATRVTVRNNNRQGSKTQFRVFTRREFGNRCGEPDPQPTLYAQQYMWASTPNEGCANWSTGMTQTYYTERIDQHNPGVIYIDSSGSLKAPGGIYMMTGGLWVNWTGSYVVAHGNC